MKGSENNSIFKPRMLTLEDLPWLLELGKVEGDLIKIELNRAGRRLRTPISVPVDQILAVGQDGLVRYIFDSFLPERPKLIPFVFENRSLIELANYLLRFRSGSHKTFYLYTHLLEYFSRWVGRKPDGIIADIMGSGGSPDPKKIQIHSKALENYVAHLQDRKLAPNRICNYIKAVKALYCANRVRIDLPYSLPRRSTSQYRAPTPEEIQRLLNIADLRESVIIVTLALGGFREGTLPKLRYRHVKHDLEAGIVPLHVHIEAEITKGKYHDYDTYLGSEAVEYLKPYLESRRRGSPDGKIPPEEITDDSPLIRDSRSKVPKPIGEKQIYQLIHNLYFKAGLLKRSVSGGYDLKVHSLRKFFKTQLTALGVQPDYIDYMMGHTIDTYNDVQSKGVEFLRGIYAAANLSIRPKPELSRLDQLKVFARGLGLDPERCIMEGSFAESHRTFVSGDLEERQITLLSSAIKNAIKQEVLAELQSFESPEIRGWSGGAARI